MPVDEHRRVGEDPKLIDPRRSAHASIRGFLYQTCLGALRWLDLQPDETLLCEGDEDLDRFLLDGGSVSEQVKAYTGELSITDRVIRESLRNFLRSYVVLRRRGEARRFLFTTTAQQKGQRRGSFDLLEAWKTGTRTPEMFAAIRSLLQPGSGDSGQEESEGALAWLDAQTDGWKGFLDAVEWSFGAPDVEGIRRKIGDRLAVREDTRLLPGDVFRERLIFEVLLVSSRKEPSDRLLTREDLARLVEEAGRNLTAWAATPPAQRLRRVFEEVAEIGRLLHDNTDALPPNPSPGKLLTAAYEVIPFEEAGRRAELEALEKWCGGEERRSVLLLTGEGGSGKTRLMIEWCRRLRQQGWHAGFLRRDRSEADLDPLLQGVAPRLMVIDYAETRLEVVEPLLLKMGLDGEAGPTLRLVLLARRATDWWENLSRTDRAVEDLLLRSPEPRSIAPLVPDAGERRRAYGAAVAALAPYLGGEIPAGVPVPDLEQEDFKRALYLHMAALAALAGERAETGRDALARTLGHERIFWRNQVDELGLDRALSAVVREALEPAVAALTLVGGAADLAQARELLDQILESFPLRSDLPATMIGLLRRLYGGSQGPDGRYLDPLQPDPLGEQLVAECLARDVRLLDKVFQKAGLQAAHSILTVLTRLARRRPEASPWLRTALQNHLEDLAEISLNVAVETGDPIGIELAQVVDQHSSAELARKLMDLCAQDKYSGSVPLREVDLVATRKTLESLRQQETDPENEDQKFEIALLNYKLSNRLGSVGQPVEAIPFAQEAVNLFRPLAERQPDFLLEFAVSLTELGSRLHDVGRREESLSAVQEAVAIYRRLVEQDADRFLLLLSGTLNNLGLFLSDVGREEDALQVFHEAVDIQTRLVGADPDNLNSQHLAQSLINLGKLLRTLGQREEAAQHTGKGIEINRRLVERRPDIYLPELAGSLDNMGVLTSELGRFEEALRYTQEAVAIYQSLAERRPKAFLPDYAMSLMNLGSRSGFGQSPEAFQVAQEAVAAYRSLAAERPDVFRPGLMSSLNNLSLHLAASGRLEEALAANQEAVDLGRQLLTTEAATFLPNFALSLNNLGQLLADLGRHEESARAHQEAAAARRQLASRQPEVFRPLLAESLHHLGNQLDDLGRHEEAVRATQEALDIARSLADRSPGTLTFLAICLNNLGNQLGNAGRLEDALGASQEAVELRRQLALRDPEEALPALSANLTNLAFHFKALGRLDEACQTAEEALRTLAPFFWQRPDAFRALMGAVAKNYRVMAEETGQSPDAQLLDPIEEILAAQVPEQAAEPSAAP